MAATRPFRVLCAASAMLSGLAVPASAGGLSTPVDVATKWGGFYIGGQLGGTWDEADWHYDIDHWRVHCGKCSSPSFLAAPIVDGDIPTNR